MEMLLDVCTKQVVADYEQPSILELNERFNLKNTDMRNDNVYETLLELFWEKGVLSGWKKRIELQNKIKELLVDPSLKELLDTISTGLEWLENILENCEIELANKVKGILKP
ncbi:hypothetical protein COEREDRAFT_90072 [Coemansia reversa NRRL 1564]|uniref:Uncharacterized protein n=1 Tax=Coemansia reversa (strain ATCC 12441 / NRRL 1564) TaxID=763665 RepID=A0A2G5B198_COERN|nr:hypothetical protein COEREDRAFT_90072 [Coemansia reversa NRRL 1564]|eukprot:PIA12764.1 hypothetical protein COEREDRAFT_90072 [Coemansia reversa NRRL 1564]